MFQLVFEVQWFGRMWSFLLVCRGLLYVLIGCIALVVTVAISWLRGLYDTVVRYIDLEYFHRANTTAIASAAEAAAPTAMAPAAGEAAASVAAAGLATAVGDSGTAVSESKY